jgi:hypothetical protein
MSILVKKFWVYSLSEQAKIDIIKRIGKCSLKRLLALLKLAHRVNDPDTGTAPMAMVRLFDLIEANW